MPNGLTNLFKRTILRAVKIPVIYFIIGLVRTCLHFLLPDIENQTGFMQVIIFLFLFLMILVLGPYVETILRIFLIKFFGIL